MRFLFTILPCLSHLHPIVPIARAVARNGHDVAFATAARFRPAVESAGFPCFAAGLDWLAEETGKAFPGWDEIPPEQRNRFEIEVNFAERCPPPMIDDLLRLGESFAPDLFVPDLWELGAWIAAETRGVPHAFIGLSGGVALPFELLREVLDPPLARLRERYGLPPDPGLARLHGYLRLDLVPPGFRRAGADPGPFTHDIRPVSFDRTVTGDAPPWLAELPFPRTVLVTLGTVFNRDREAFEALLAGLAGEPVNVIVTVGTTQDPASFGPQPPHVRIERYVPYSLLADRVDAVVTHGGYTTVMTFLGAGVPMVIIPLSADHPVNAGRAARMGAAVKLRRAGLRPEAVREAVRAVLGVPCYREAAQRVRAAMLAQPGPEHAALLLERLARERRPIPRPAAGEGG